MQGSSSPLLRRVTVKTSATIKLDSERPEYHRVTLHWQDAVEDQAPCLVAVGLGSQRSSRLLSARSANGLIEAPKGTGTIEPGSMMPCLLIDDLRDMPLAGFPLFAL